MTRSRRDARADYRHFPAAYTELLLRFQNAGEARAGPMTRREAEAARRDLYRFLGYLRNAPPDDDHARALTTIASEITWRLELSSPQDEPPHQFPPRTWYITAARNPISRALAKE